LQAWLLRHRESNPYHRFRLWNPATWAQWNQQFRQHALSALLAVE
jgi:hypothetical protein